MSEQTKPAYEVHKELRFEVCGEEFAIISIYDGDAMHIEETRKNGQEDCHMSGLLILVNGAWQWEDKHAYDTFNRYGNDGVADAIPAYINANPPPLDVL